MIDTKRLIAYNIITSVTVNKAYGNIALSNALDRSELSDADKSFCTVLVKTVLERLNSIDYALSILSSIPTGKIEKPVKNLLRCGLAQILYMDKVPHFAVCDETVKLTEKICKKGAKGFVNGVLRSASRRKNELLEKIDSAEPSVKYSVSRDIYRLFKAQYPYEFVSLFRSGGDYVPPLSLRVNTLKTTREALISRFESEGAQVEAVGVNGIYVKTKTAEILRGIKTGEYFVQGMSSQRAVELLGAKSGETVIDVCACPGGKTCGAAIDMEGKGSIYAFDIHANKLSLIEDNAKRLGIDIIKAAERDSTQPDETLIGKADRVICDVPCSGSGCIAKRHELRYKSLDELNALCEIQRDILFESVRYLKKGGTLVYSVCSINKNEGEAVVSDLINNFDGYTLVSQECFVDAYDGFYMAKIRKDD